MRIAVLSDLHLSVHGMPTPAPDCDLVVLAGDIARPFAAIEWARRFSTPVVYVPGNHEFYGGSIDGTIRELRELSINTNVHILERASLTFRGVRFLGCTLWSDFRLSPEEEDQQRWMQQAVDMIWDFRRIKRSEHCSELLTPAETRRLFDESVSWLNHMFATPFDGPTVVVTHFAPSRRSIHEKYADSPLNACFVSDLDERVQAWKPRLWIHGHTHDTHRYMLGGTEVVCNPRGYAKDGIPENRHFDASLTIDL